MGIADFAFSNSVSFRKKNSEGEATEITLEPRGASIVAKNQSGQELYTLNDEGNGEYSMRDNHGQAVLRTRRDVQNTNAFNIFDKEERIIGQTSGGSFQWENLSISWTAKTIGLLSDAMMVAYKDPESPASPKTSKEDHLAEFKMATTKSAGLLKVPAPVALSENLPPLGLFLFEAMVLNQGYLHSSPLQRLSMTSSFRKRPSLSKAL